jgi:hypothetical protein
MRVHGLRTAVAVGTNDIDTFLVPYSTVGTLKQPTPRGTVKAKGIPPRWIAQVVNRPICRKISLWHSQ